MFVLSFIMQIVLYISYQKELAFDCNNVTKDGSLTYYDNQCTEIKDLCEMYNLTFVKDLDKHDFAQCYNGTHNIPLDKVKSSILLSYKYILVPFC